MTTRASGAPLHPSLPPNPYGIGDLGAGTERLLEWIEAAGQNLSQILPLAPLLRRAWKKLQCEPSGHPLLEQIRQWARDEETAYQEFLRLLFLHQIRDLRERASQRCIFLFGDLPFYVAMDGCDVWTRPKATDA